MEGMDMLRLPQIVRLFATFALVCGISAASSAQAPAPPASSVAKGKASQAKSPSGKAKTAKVPGKTATKAAAKAPVAETTTEGAAVSPAAHRRDPFAPLVGAQQVGPAIPAHLPPGKAGLMVSTLRLDGVVRAPNGMLAVVTNPQQRTYFLRQGDRLYDGHVEQISMDGVSFKETGKDPFGKPIERVVTKRIYPSAGEQ